MKEFFTYLTKQLEKKPPLRFARLAPEVWKSLGKIKRSGWVKRGVPNPETVQEHTIATMEIVGALSDLTPEEQEKLRNMIEIHDWPESEYGDQIVDGSTKEEVEGKLKDKFKKEQEIMISITSRLGNAGEEILALWMEFETSQDKIASLARQLDKYQAIDQAYLYEKKYGIKLFEEFYNHDIHHITYPALREDLDKLMQSRLRLKK